MHAAQQLTENEILIVSLKTVDSGAIGCSMLLRRRWWFCRVPLTLFRVDGSLVARGPSQALRQTRYLYWTKVQYTDLPHFSNRLAIVTG